MPKSALAGRIATHGGPSRPREIPMTEELRTQMESLRAIAPRLNGATNQAAAAIKAADDFLADLSLGVPALGGPYEERSAADPDDAATAKDVVFSYLAYGRLGVTGRYSIHVVERTERPVVDGWGNIESWEVIGEDARAWSGCPRDQKLKSFAKLPALLGNIADEAKLLAEKAEETGALVETMFGGAISEQAAALAEVGSEATGPAAGPVRRIKPRKSGR
jgi:hypothetical protein